MSSDFYAGRGGGGAAPASHPAGGGGGVSIPHPSGGGGGGIHISPGGGGGGAVSRPQKTEVLNHSQQAAIGGPGAPSPHIGGGPEAHPGMPHSGGVTPNIGEHQGAERQGLPPSARDERGHPDQFRNFDPRFDQDRDRLHNDFWRTAFTDYDRDRFLPLIGEDPWLYQIYGVQYYPELLQYAIPYYPTSCGPWNEGIWTIGADSRWYPIHRHQLDIVRRIDGLRGLRGYEPVIIPNCSVGGAALPVVTPYLI